MARTCRRPLQAVSTQGSRPSQWVDVEAPITKMSQWVEAPITKMSQWVEAAITKTSQRRVRTGSVHVGTISVGQSVDHATEDAGMADGSTSAWPVALHRHGRRLYIGMAGGSTSAWPAALHRHGRRLYIGMAGGSKSVWPTARESPPFQWGGR